MGVHTLILNNLRRVFLGCAVSPMPSHHLQQRFSHNRGCFGNSDSRFLKGGNLRSGCAFTAADDSAGVTHTAARWSGGSSDEAGDWLAAVLFNPDGSFFFFRAANLANHNNSLCVGIVIEHLDHIQVRGAVDGITANADASGLAHSSARELPNGSVGQFAAAG